MLKRLLSAFFSLFFLGAASGTSFAEVTVPDALKDRIALKKTARQLNIVYFLGSDTEPVPDYERRLSELLFDLGQCRLQRCLFIPCRAGGELLG